MRRSTCLYLILFVGCADSIAVDDYGPAIWQATCDWYVRCGALAEGDCALHLAAPDGIPAAAVKAGVTSYDGEAAATCVAAYADLPCDVTEPYPDFSSCERVFHGRKPFGEPCALSIECQDGDCFYPDGFCDDRCCEGDEGTCDRQRPTDPLPQLGETCDNGSCARGLYCSYTSQPPTCAARPKRGEPCVERGSCAELGDNCDTLTKTCEDAAVRGEACVDTADCTRSYGCDASNRCVSGEDLQPDGSSCGPFRGCQSGYCDDTNVCAPAPVCY